MTTATKSKFYKSKFNQTCMESYPVGGVSGDPSAVCIPCCKKLSCHHEGLKIVTDYSKMSLIKLNLNLRKNNHQLQTFWYNTTSPR